MLSAPRSAGSGRAHNERLGGPGGDGRPQGPPLQEAGWPGLGFGRSRAGLGRRSYARVGRGWARREEGERTVGWGVLGLTGNDATPGLPGAGGSRLRTPG